MGRNEGDLKFVILLDRGKVNVGIFCVLYCCQQFDLVHLVNGH